MTTTSYATQTAPTAPTGTAASVDLPHERWWVGPLATTIGCAPFLLYISQIFGSIGLLLPVALLLLAWVLPPRRSHRPVRIGLCAAAAALVVAQVGYVALIMVIWMSAT
ncbi:hypothetical protein [Streptomyces boninensis]|uniref:hypothetical protein n=1 Tax=Streptomyces boninensis TaxID=2039455 RepID=UPI003B21040E